MVKDADEIDALQRRGARGRRDRGRDARRVRSRAAPSSTCTASSSSACSRPATSGRTSRSSPPARNAASPHHEPRPTASIADGDVVLCDFGGTMHGYCSDITRMFHVGEPPTEVRDVVRGARRGAGGGRARRDRRHAVRRGRRRRPARHRRRRLRRAVRAPRRARHRHRGARGPVHGRGQRRRRSRPATRSASSPASTSPAGSACGSRTSWSRPTHGPCASTTRRATSRSSADRSREARRARRSCCSGPTGGLLFCWVTTRRREVGLGYGWLLRSVFGVMAVGAVALFVDAASSRPRAASRSRRAIGVVRRGRGRAASSRSCGAARACAAGRSCAPSAGRASRR